MLIKLLLMISIFVAEDLLAKEYRVGVLYWSVNIEGQLAMRKGLEEEAVLINKKIKKIGDYIHLIPYTAGDGEAGAANQITQMDYMIEHDNIDLIIVQPADSASLVGPLLSANKKNIPVIAFDQYIAKGELASYITSNNYQAGYLGGEYLASLFPNDYEIKLVLVEYPKVSSTVERVDGLMDALKKENQKIKVIGSFEAVEPKSGKKAGRDILAKFPKRNSVDVIFTVNDGGGLNVVNAIALAKRDEIKIATIDGDPKSVKNIKNKRNTVIDSAQFCAELGRQSMKVALKILKKERFPKNILIPTYPITLSTLDRYPGWLGKIPNKFEKPWKKGSFWNNELIEKY